MRTIVFFLIFYSWAMQIIAQDNSAQLKDPLAIAKLIGDKLVRETPFAYRLELASDNKEFSGMQMVDFGRNFTVSGKTLAYAYTRLEAPDNMEMDIQLGHNDACTIWLNGQLVYQSNTEQKLELIYDERSIELSFHFVAKLKKGGNSLLIKSVTNRADWRVYLQPPSNKGAVLNKKAVYPEIGLGKMELVDKRVSAITNWLVIGPFAGDKRIENLLSPTEAPVFGQMFQGSGEQVTWTVPKIDVIGNLIDPRPWGTNYHWNYHNGGVAWAMKMLGEISGEQKYEKYADDFCDFQLRSIPFVKYEMETLGKINVPNGALVNTPLLDFTLAPSLPFIYRLRQENTFANRDEYKQFVERMLHYARYEQIRLPGASNFTRTTPQKFTTWVDDMFMGIPFLVQASLYADNEADRKFFLDDAASQVLDFNKQVWDTDANLYVHARYSTSNEKLVHWSRANGWGIWATTEVLLHLPKNHPKYKAILKYYQAHVESLARFQDEAGFWHNVLDHPESKQEVSGTAIFTMAIARGVSNGWISRKNFEPIVQKGWKACATQVEKDGTVHNICYGTMCSPDVKYYMDRPFYDNDTHGLFAVLFAAIEVSKMQSQK
ncbi:MAG: glycoside hydrolase family 88 protein [Prolixibacteraceae bacterium]|nr:glycoside hydrolase family 88 protein [Prolixibacteraceae bacterium]